MRDFSPYASDDGYPAPVVAMSAALVARQMEHGIDTMPIDELIANSGRIKSIFRSCRLDYPQQAIANRLIKNIDSQKYQLSILEQMSIKRALNYGQPGYEQVMIAITDNQKKPENPVEGTRRNNYGGASRTPVDLGKLLADMLAGKNTGPGNSCCDN